MNDPALLNRTARRVIDVCKIPLDVVVDIGDGLVAVPEAYRSQIELAFASQGQYQRWLARQYSAMYVPVNAVGDGVWMLGPRATLQDRRPSTLQWQEIVDGPTGALADSLPRIDGLVSATCSGTARLTGHHDSAGVLVNDGQAAFRDGSSLRVSTRVRSVFDVAVGSSGYAGGNAYGAFYNGAAVGFGGIDGKTPDPVTLSWSGVVSLTLHPSAPGVPLMLITGPSVLTWGEVGCGRSFVFAEATDVASVMDLVLPAITDPNARSRAAKRVDDVRARGRDVFGWVKYSLNVPPHRFYGPTSRNWRECQSANVVRDGIDWGAVNSAIGANATHMIFGAVSGRDALDRPALLGVEDLEVAVFVEIFPDGLVAVSNCADDVRAGLGLDNIVEWVQAVHLAGARVELAVEPGFPDAYSAVRAELAQVVADMVPPLGDLWSTESGDCGACAALCFAEAIRPKSATQIASIRAMTDPLYMSNGYGIG